MEAEELRYEKEVLEWKLQEAAGTRYTSTAPTPLTPSVWPGLSTGVGPQPAFNGSIERALQAKHVSIYPTMPEVSSQQRRRSVVRTLVSDLPCSAPNLFFGDHSVGDLSAVC